MLRGRNIKLPEKSWERVEELARREGVSVNSMVNKLVNEALIYRDLKISELISLAVEVLKKELRRKSAP